MHLYISGNYNDKFSSFIKISGLYSIFPNKTDFERDLYAKERKPKYMHSFIELLQMCRDLSP